jgi:hypothetical protein
MLHICVFCAGVNGGEATPDPMPNSEVKLSCADDTLYGESRSTPA